jgi:hypothetical protein
MLTFISGWRSQDRDRAVLTQRDLSRRSIFFIDNQSALPELMPYAPLIELWRHGRADFPVGDECETLVRLNHDTDNHLLVRAVTHALLHNHDTQIVVTYDAQNQLSQLYPALREIDALMAVDERFDAPTGDRVMFSRGGSFRWRDYELEAKTSLLLDGEVYDSGVVEDNDEINYERYADYDYR